MSESGRYSNVNYSRVLSSKRGSACYFVREVRSVREREIERERESERETEKVKERQTEVTSPLSH